MFQHALSVLQGLVISLAAGGAYFFAYRVNEFFDTWVLYAQGINLVFLPAGIKHIAILIAGKWGALGCLISLFMLATEFWNGFPVSQIAFYSAISTGSTWLGIILSLRILQIDSDLLNLKFIHLTIMDFFTTSVHSLTTNLFFNASGMKSNDMLKNAFAMMLGDYIGSFIVLTILWFGLTFLKKTKIDQDNIL